MSNLGRVFFDSIDVFNATFGVGANPSPDPAINPFAPYYDPHVVIHTPHVGKQSGIGTVLASLVNSAPLYFDPTNISNLRIDENAKMVTGDTMYTDNDPGQGKLTFPITFMIRYKHNAGAPGGWIVIEAFSR